jgi:hypothetical protein
MPTQPLVELQISASAFLNAQLLGLQAQKLAFPPPIKIGDLQLVVDHVEFGSNRLDHSVLTEEFIYHKDFLAPNGILVDRVKGRKVLIVQPLTVFVADLADILAHPNEPPSRLVPIQATIFVRLSYFVDGFGKDQFQSSFDHLEIAPLPPLPPGIDGDALKQQFQAFAAKLIPSTTISLGLAGKASIINTGISVDTDLTRIALRLEVGTGIEADPAIWQSFFQGNVPDHLQEAGFAIFNAASILEEKFAIEISQGIASSHDERFELVSGVSSTYSNPGGVPKLHATFSGNVNTPICTVWADIFVDAEISLASPTSLVLSVDLSRSLSTSACVVTVAILGAAIGLVANVVVPLGALIIDPILGSMIGIAAFVYFSGTQGFGNLPVPDCKQQSESHLDCIQGIPVINTPFGKLNVNTLTAFDDGISLQGQLLAIPVGAPQLKIDLDTPFHYLPTIITCADVDSREVDEFRKNPKAHVRLRAGVTITAESLAPIYLLDAHVVNDPLGVFADPLNIQGSQAPITIALDVGYPGDAYFDNPYPCDILISTTGGERLVSIPAPPPLTQQEIDRLAGQLESEVGSCIHLIGDWFHNIKFHPDWIVDPGPGDRVVDHFYEFEINGLRAGEMATVFDKVDRVLVRGLATAGQTLRMSAVVAPAAANEIGVIRGAGVRSEGGGIGQALETVVTALGLEEEPAKRGIGVIEQLIVRTATIILPGICQRLAVAYSEGVPCALAVLSDRLMAFDLSNPSVPVTRFSVPISGLRGVLAHEASLVAFGEDGFFLVDSSGVRPATCDCSGKTAVYGAAFGTGVLYSLTDNGLELFSPRFARLLTIPIEASGALARAGHRLVTANEKGLVVFSIASPRRPERMEGFRMSGIQDLVKPPDGFGQTLLAVAESGPSKLFDFSRGDDPKPVADYPQLPWYVGSARLGNLFVKLDSGGSAIQVSFFGNSRLQ